jgi:hypothetical protein
MKVFKRHPSPQVHPTTHSVRGCPVLLPLTLAGLFLWLGVPSLLAADPDDPKDPTNSSATGRWQTLFDGRTLDGWKIVNYAGHGEVKVEEGAIRLGSGIMLTGVTYTNTLPKVDYEVELEAQRLDGYDFFCGFTFPVRDSFCTLIVGGWGGGLVGLSSIDDYDASENETTQFMRFERERWYKIRVRVSEPKIEAWIDNDKIIDLSIVDRKVSLRPGEIESSIPFGISTWQTSAALRNLRIRPVPPPGG